MVEDEILEQFSMEVDRKIVLEQLLKQDKKLIQAIIFKFIEQLYIEPTAGILDT
jgi:hypothetical protein